MGVFFPSSVSGEHYGERRMSLTSVTLKRQEILARDLRFTSSGTFALKVDFRKVSDSKVKQEGQEEIRKVGGGLIRQVAGAISDLSAS
jgi:hypothetical protein